MQIRHQNVLVLILLFWTFYLRGQSPNPIKKSTIDSVTTFQNFTIEDGLPSNRIYDIYQDKYGYYWIATNKGLSRFDGKEFKNYFHSIKDTLTISSNDITRVTEDSKGELWIGTKKGLNKLNRKNYTFVRYVHDNYNYNSLPGNHIRALLPDKDGIIWIETGNGFLSCFNPNKTSFENFDHGLNIHIYPSHTLTKLNGDSIMILAKGMHPKIFNLTKKEFESIDFNTINLKNFTSISNCTKDNDGRIWFGDSAGNFIFNTDSNLQNAKQYPYSVGSIYDMTTDESGQIWMGGWSGGVLRVDNHNKPPTNYRHNTSNPKSIINNQINKIYIDKNKNIWFATSGGLSRLIKNNSIKHIDKPKNILSIVEGTDSSIWIGTFQDGLFKYNRKDGSLKNWSYDKNNPNGIAANRIQTLHLDKDGFLWLGLWAGVGFQIFNVNTEQFETYKIHKSSNSSDWYYDILETRNGDMYLGVWGPGVLKFDKKMRQFENFDLNGSFSSSFRKSPIRYLDKKIWTHSELYDPLTKLRRRTLPKIPDDEKSDYLKTTNPHLYFTPQKDKNFRIYQKWSTKNKPYNFHHIGKDLWLPTNEGLFVLDTATFSSRELRVPSQDEIVDVKENISDKSIMLLTKYYIHLLDESQKSIDHSIEVKPPLKELEGNHMVLKGDSIFIYNDHRLSYYNVSNNKWHEFPVKDIIKSVCFIDKKVWIAYNDTIECYDVNRREQINVTPSHPYFKLIKNIRCIEAATPEDLWIGTSNGLYHIDIKNDVTTPYFHSDSKKNSLLHNSIHDIEFGKEGELWITTDLGLTQLIINQNRFVHHHLPTNDGVSHRHVSSLFEDSNQNIWIGNTKTSLDCYNPETGYVEHFFHEPWNHNSFNPVAMAFFEDNQQNIWVGGSALSKFNKLSNDFTHYKPKTNVQFSQIKSILGDEYNNLWIGTDLGLYIFNISTEQFKLLGLKDNIQSLEFSNAACNLRTGEFVFGGKNGLNIIDVKNFQSQQNIYDINFVSIKTKKQYFEYEFDNNVVLNLDPSENNLVFELGIITNDVKDRFRYRIKELDTLWTEANVVNRTFEYENLPPGQYTFQLTNTGKDGGWNDEIKVIEINIDAPIWEKLWFKVILVLLLLTISYVLLRARLRKIQKEQELDIKVKLLHLKTLQAQINPHFIYNVLSSIKHLVVKGEKEDAGNRLGDLGKLMRRFLEHSVKFDTTNASQKGGENDIILNEEIELIKLYVEFEQFTYGEDKFDFVLKISPKINTSLYSIPPMLIQPFVENAIKHGIFLKKEPNYRGLLEIDVSIENDEFLIFKIIDNGVGISKAKEIQQNTIKPYKSRGGKLVADRIETLQHLGYEIEFDINDRPGGGTIVEVRIQI